MILYFLCKRDGTFLVSSLLLFCKIKKLEINLVF
nr:MAG TPA: hypothetical protein [Caudoviricetes sp.]